MAATLIQSPDKVLLKNISWQTYQSLVKDFEQQPAIRLTYDCGLLEIRMPLDPHETYKKLLGRLVEALTEELEIEIRSLGSRTCAREDLGKGLEPDQCYHIQNEPAVWDKEQIDLTQDPPPDLAIEVDITSSSINRLDIYLDLGVPEVWRSDGQSLTICILENRKYQLRDRSIAFPLLTTQDIERFLNLKKTTKENALIRIFRQWVRENIDAKE
ncbi:MULTISPECIES: Uma2 family endonuclease [Nostocales]|uniref:Uma2 family endonuclease n=3 Tax=Nostocales TaxID=1161 RepID=A0A0C1NHH4_9CYAN|nr:Uma2 family endonuclease [Tolypothrix bouteillei]KAF3890369.1 Uma2 family endonuclease [Tolypothrix bouteillei VB521301]